MKLITFAIFLLLLFAACSNDSERTETVRPVEVWMPFEQVTPARDMFETRENVPFFPTIEHIPPSEAEWELGKRYLVLNTEDGDIFLYVFQDDEAVIVPGYAMGSLYGGIQFNIRGVDIAITVTDLPEANMVFPGYAIGFPPGVDRVNVQLPDGFSP